LEHRRHLEETPARAWARALEKTAPLHRSPEITLPALLDSLAATLGAKVALSSDHDVVSYAELAYRANQYARWALAQGLAAGDVVCLLMHNCVDYAAIWLGISRVGSVVALLNTNLTGGSLQHALAVASPQHVIAGEDLVAALEASHAHLPTGTQFWTFAADGLCLGPRLVLDRRQYSGCPLRAEECAPVPMRQTALLIYTSGTTGLPKAVKLSHYRIMEWSFWFAGMMNMQPDDRLFNCLPMYHSTGGIVGIGATLVSGGTVVIRRRFSASRFWDDIVAHGCTQFLYIGELCRYLLSAPRNPRETEHHLRLCFGNGLRKDVWERFAARFDIPRIIEFYAATEGNVSLYNSEGRPGAIGRVPPFLAHRFPVALIRCGPVSGEPVRDQNGRYTRCEAGEIGEAIGMIRAGADAGTQLFEGYTDAVATERKILRNVFASGDAWFRTGDLMRRDNAGFFYFVDRVGDTFRWKGENVSTTEVGEVVAACPGVTGSVVFGVEVPGAEGRAGMAAITTGVDFNLVRLHAHLSKELAEWARILFLRLCTSLNATGTFKPVKERLVCEGYGINAAGEVVYFNSPESRTFEPLDAAMRDRIRRGDVRL
jgi:fatty-acyl-CoA synthase